MQILKPLVVMNRHKIYSSLMILGASILLFRTIRLLTIEDGWHILAYWVIILTFIEMAIDVICIFYSFQWLINKTKTSKSVSLQFGAIAAIFHAFRVLIYALGRTETFQNFDVKTQFRSTHHVEMFWVYFAVILSILGIAGVLVIWRINTRKNKQRT